MNKFKVGDKVNIIGRLMHKKQILGGIWEIVKSPKQTGYDRCCLCYQKGFNGHNASGEYPTNEYFYIREENLMLYQEKYSEIRITTDGKTTIAQKRLNRKILKEASVTLYYKDTFDFNIGCEEALKKLNTVPHLKWNFNDDNLGEIGELTEQTAIFGEKLCIGDIVEVCNLDTGFIYNPSVVTRDKGCRGFIMGFGYKKFVNGVYDCWQLRKIKSYKDLQNGEIIGGVEVVK